MPRASRVLLPLVAVVALTSTARAQNCLGAPSFAVGMARVSGFVSIADSLKTYGGDLALGRDKGFFIEGGGSHSKLNDSDQSSNQGGGRIGYQMAIDPMWQFCPYAGVTVGSGSAAGDHPTVPLNSVDVYGGGSIGWLAYSSGGTQVIPSVGAAAVRRSMTNKLVPAGQSAATGTDNFALITGAIGFVFNSNWTITPNVQIPAKESNSSVTYGVSLSVNFNGLKR